MKVPDRYEKYLKLPEYQRQKMAIEWCLRILNVNLDRMKSKSFAELVTEYESIVKYPYKPYVRWRFHDEDEAKAAFMEYQTIANSFIDMIKRLSPGTSRRLKTKKSLAISTSSDGKISMTFDIDQGFKFSFAHHIARLLDGNKFNEVVKLCPNCGQYFPILTGHGRTYCSRGCATKYRQKKKWKKNPELTRCIRNLQMQFYRLKKKYPKHKDRVRRELIKYIEKREYEENEIPKVIRSFIEMKA